MAKPFIKCPGGKRKLAAEITALFRPDFDSYYELFLGGGAVFFKAQELGLFGRATFGFDKPEKFIVLNEFDGDLANLYRAVRDSPRTVYSHLEYLVGTKDLTSIPDAEALYARLRQSWNTGDRSPEKNLYLRYACYNGLFRQNSLGAMNTPWNKSLKLSLPSLEDFVASGDALLGTMIFGSSFEECIDPTQDISKAVIFVDPPYLGGWVNYTAEGWNHDNAVMLLDNCRQWCERGAQVIHTHSDTPEFREIVEAYWPKARIIEHGVRRPINSDGKKRGKVPEVILVG